MFEQHLSARETKRRPANSTKRIVGASVSVNGEENKGISAVTVAHQPFFLLREITGGPVLVGRQLFIQLRLSLKRKRGEYRFASEMRSLELVSVLSHCIYLSDSQQDGRGGGGAV